MHSTTNSLSQSTTLTPSVLSTSLASNVSSSAQSAWPSHSIVFIIMYTIVLVLSWLGNTIILIVIIRRRRMRNVTNFFIANIAIANLMYAPCAIIQSLTALKESWLLYDFMCPLLAFFSTLSIIVNTSTMIAASIERLIVIIYPFKSKMGKCKCVIVISLIWLFAIVASLPWLHFIRIQIQAGNSQLVDPFEHSSSMEELRVLKKRELDEIVLSPGMLRSNITTAHPEDVFSGLLNPQDSFLDADAEDESYENEDYQEEGVGESSGAEANEIASNGAPNSGDQTRLCIPFEYGYLIRVYIVLLCIIQYFMPLMTLCVSYVVIAYYILHVNSGIETRFEMKIHNQHVSNRNKKRASFLSFKKRKWLYSYRGCK